jgi:hypothetical protein
MNPDRPQDLQYVPRHPAMPQAPEVPGFNDQFPRQPIYIDHRPRRMPYGLGDMGGPTGTYQMLIRDELRKLDLERSVADLSIQEGDRKKAVADLKKQEDEKKKTVAELKKQEDDKKKAVADLSKQEDDRKRNVADLDRRVDDTRRRIENWQDIEDGYRIRRPSRSISPFGTRHFRRW